MTAICDTHLHIFEPKNFPYAACPYTPSALLPQLRANMTSPIAGRCVLVKTWTGRMAAPGPDPWVCRCGYCAKCPIM